MEGQGEGDEPALAHRPGPSRLRCSCLYPSRCPHPLQALMDNPSLVFVRPRWIYSCSEKQKLLPHQLYGVVPRA